MNRFLNLQEVTSFLNQHHEYNPQGVDKEVARGELKPTQFLRLILCNYIAVDCILRGKYPNICIYALNNIQAPYSYKLFYAPEPVIRRNLQSLKHSVCYRVTQTTSCLYIAMFSFVYMNNNLCKLLGWLLFAEVLQSGAADRGGTIYSVR